MPEEIQILRDWWEKNEDEISRSWHDKLRFVQNIQPILPAFLEIVSLPPGYEEGMCVCFAYAAGLSKDPMFLKKDRTFDSPVRLTGDHFVELLSSNLLEETETPVVGDYVLYQHGQTYNHAGIYLDNDVVQSKWGDGPVLKHHIAVVPSSFGDKVIFCKQQNPQMLKESLIVADNRIKDTERKRRERQGRDLLQQ